VRFGGVTVYLNREQTPRCVARALRLALRFLHNTSVSGSRVRVLVLTQSAVYTACLRFTSLAYGSLRLQFNASCGAGWAVF